MLGYHFEFYNDDKYQGYIIISATKERNPILQYSIGEMGYDLDQSSKDEKIYYLGATNYLTAKNKENLKEKFIINKNKQIEQEALKNKKEFINNTEITNTINELERVEIVGLDKDKDLYKNDWDFYLSNQSARTLVDNDIELYATSKTLSVTRIWQRLSGITSPGTACGPTVGAMVNNYYYGKNYNVNSNGYYGGNAAMVNRLSGLMNTVFCGTSASNYRDGLRKQLNSKYSTTSPFRAFVQNAGGLFTSYKTSIDTSHPVALRFNLISNGYANHHFVLGVGYNGSQFALKDPDGGEFNTTITWASWNNNQNKMSMIHTSFYF